MQSKWAWKSYRRQFFVFSSSSQHNPARMRLAWGRWLRALHDWGSLLNWSTPSLNFSPQLSTHFQGQPKIQFLLDLCTLLMQDDLAITCEIRRQELGRSHGLERVWRLWRLWTGLQEMASDVEDSTRRHTRCHEHIAMDDRGLEEVSHQSLDSINAKVVIETGVCSKSGCRRG